MSSDVKLTSAPHLYNTKQRAVGLEFYSLPDAMSRWPQLENTSIPQLDSHSKEALLTRPSRERGPVACRVWVWRFGLQVAPHSPPNQKRNS